jgi:hypothetical protein
MKLKWEMKASYRERESESESSMCIGSEEMSALCFWISSSRPNY